MRNGVDSPSTGSPWKQTVIGDSLLMEARMGAFSKRPFESVAAIGLFITIAACTQSARTAPSRGEGGPPESRGMISSEADVIPIMQAKLGYTHALLDAIALRDFLQIEASAMSLVELSEAADWQAHDTVYYRIFSDRFREAAEDVAMQSRSEDIDAVSRAYVRLTMSCVDCHSYLRRENLTKDMPVRITLRD